MTNLSSWSKSFSSICRSVSVGEVFPISIFNIFIIRIVLANSYNILSLWAFRVTPTIGINVCESLVEHCTFDFYFPGQNTQTILWCDSMVIRVPFGFRLVFFGVFVLNCIFGHLFYVKFGLCWCSVPYKAILNGELPFNSKWSSPANVTRNNCLPLVVHFWMQNMCNTDTFLSMTKLPLSCANFFLHLTIIFITFFSSLIKAKSL